MLKFFTNVFKGNESDSIAINPDHVASVYESISNSLEEDEIYSVTNIFCVNGTCWQVEEDYLTVVARLNERD